MLLADANSSRLLRTLTCVVVLPLQFTSLVLPARVCTRTRSEHICRFTLPIRLHRPDVGLS